MLVVWNPTTADRTKSIPLDLYYAGLVDRAAATAADGSSHPLALDRRCRTHLNVAVPAGGSVWFVMR